MDGARRCLLVDPDDGASRVRPRLEEANVSKLLRVASRREVERVTGKEAEQSMPFFEELPPHTYGMFSIPAARETI